LLLPITDVIIMLLQQVVGGLITGAVHVATAQLRLPVLLNRILFGQSQSMDGKVY
jgi:hypothetical protein